MTAHAILGASSSERWMKCAASVPMSAPFPNTTSSYAAEGTVAHMVCEEATKAGKKASAFIGMWGDGSEAHKDEPLYAKPKKRTKFEFEVTDEMARAVQVYLDAINAKVFELELMGHTVQVGVETGFSLAKAMGRDDMFGTNDTSVFVPKVYLGVFDYKHGRGKVVEVEDNPQLKYYALGKLIEVCWNDLLGGFDEDLMPEEIELFVGQPRAPHADGPVRPWKIDPTALIEDFVAELKEAATKVDAMNAIRDAALAAKQEPAYPEDAFAVGDWCGFCKAKIVCPAFRKEAQRAMTSNFADDGLSIEELGDLAAEATKDMVTKTGKNKGAPSAKPINEWTRSKANEMAKLVAHTNSPDTIKRLLNAADLIEQFAKAVRLQAYNMVSQGVDLPDYKLVRQATKRRWAGDQSEIADTLGLFFDDEEVLFEPRKLKSFTDIEEMNPEAAKLVKGLTERPDGALVLVKSTDKREAVKASASDAFEGDELDVTELE